MKFLIPPDKVIIESLREKLKDAQDTIDNLRDYVKRDREFIDKVRKILTDDTLSDAEKAVIARYYILH